MKRMFLTVLSLSLIFVLLAASGTGCLIGNYCYAQADELSGTVKEKYYNDFENGTNLNNCGDAVVVDDFTGDGEFTVNEGTDNETKYDFYNYTTRKGNKILNLGKKTSSPGYHAFSDTVTDEIVVYESQFFADWYNGAKDVESARYGGSGAVVYGLRFTLYDSDGNALKLTGLNKNGTILGPNDSWGNNNFERNKWYDIRIAINASKAVYGYGTMTIDYKKIEDAEWTQALVTQYTETKGTNKYIHIFDGTGTNSATSSNANNALLPDKIKGIGYSGMTDYTDSVVDNVSIVVYNPLYKMIEKAENATDVKALLDYYEKYNSINTNFESDYDVNYDAVYSALAGKTFESDAELQKEYIRLCEANLEIDAYSVEISNTTSNGNTLFNVNSGDTFNTAVHFKNNTDENMNVTVINAIYGSDNSLIDISKSEQTTAAKKDVSDMTVSTTVSEDSGASYIKQFVFDTLSSLKPYCKYGIIHCVPADYTPTLYLVGDSLCQNYATDVPDESTVKTVYPYQGWGYYMNKFMDGITVDNRARSGWTTESYVHPAAGGESDSQLYYRWDSFKKQIKPGDYVLVSLGINDSGSGNVSEERYVENLKIMYDDTVNAGATPLYSTPTIYGGTDGSTDGWDYSILNGWGKRGEVCRVFAESNGAVCVPFGKTLSETYEQMYQDYMTKYGNNPTDEQISEGRDYVRHYFHIFQSDLKSGRFGYAFTNEQIQNHVGGVRKGDDAVHMNYIGAEKLAEIMCSLIKDSNCSLSEYVDMGK